MIPGFAVRSWVALAVLPHAALLCVAGSVQAQSRDSAQASVVDAHGLAVDSSLVIRRPPAPWVTRGDAVAFGVAAAATLGLAQLDQPILGELDEPQFRNSRQLHHIAGDVAFLGGDGPFIGSALLFAAFPSGHGDAVRHFAAHNMEAIALATVITGVAKGITGRALPGVDAKHKFEWGRGFHEGNGPFVSFPSGHTAAAFAMAATISGEISDTTKTVLVDRIAFSTAAAVGVARVIQRVHWPSDLPLAAVIGTWSGRVVQRHSAHSGRIGGLLRGLTLAPDGSGRAEIGWSSLAADLGR